MIIVIIVRRCVCEICHGLFDLEYGEDPPRKCRLCGSVNWEEAPEIKDAVYIRKGIAKKKKSLNPGSASGKSQERGKKQWRRFKDKDGNPV